MFILLFWNPCALQQTKPPQDNEVWRWIEAHRQEFILPLLIRRTNCCSKNTDLYKIRTSPQ